MNICCFETFYTWLRARAAVVTRICDENANFSLAPFFIALGRSNLNRVIGSIVLIEWSLLSFGVIISIVSDVLFEVRGISLDNAAH